jgi:hypothetical protein
LCSPTQTNNAAAVAAAAAATATAAAVNRLHNMDFTRRRCASAPCSRRHVAAASHATLLVVDVAEHMHTDVTLCQENTLLDDSLCVESTSVWRKSQSSASDLSRAPRQGRCCALLPQCCLPHHRLAAPRFNAPRRCLPRLDGDTRTWPPCHVSSAALPSPQPPRITPPHTAHATQGASRCFAARCSATLKMRFSSCFFDWARRWVCTQNTLRLALTPPYKQGHRLAGGRINSITDRRWRNALRNVLLRGGSCGRAV